MYQVVPIGAQFSGKGHEQLTARLTEFESQGWELVQVFPVMVSGCLGFGNKQTNYAVLRRRDGSN